jgi:hypothetical protein
MHPQRRSIGFAQALVNFQGLLGRSALATLVVEGRFFGVTLDSSLKKIETLPTSSVVTLCFANGATIDLAPEEIKVFELLSGSRAMEVELVNTGMALELLPSDNEDWQHR